MIAAAAPERRFTAWLALALPARCASCDAVGAEPFCEGCAASLDEASPMVLSCAGRALRVSPRLVYGGALAHALARLKYQRVEAVARPLGALLVAPDGYDVLLPIPSTPRRLRERGFNPARELARALPKVDVTALARPADAAPQAGASRAMRRVQVEGAFVVARPDRVRGRRVLLVDDVVTTGATLLAAGAALYAAGAAHVAALTLARSGEEADA